MSAFLGHTPLQMNQYLPCSIADRVCAQPSTGMQSSFEQRRQHTLSLLQNNAGLSYLRTMDVFSLSCLADNICSGASCRLQELLGGVTCLCAEWYLLM